MKNRKQIRNKCLLFHSIGLDPDPAKYYRSGGIVILILTLQ